MLAAHLGEAQALRVEQGVLVIYQAPGEAWLAAALERLHSRWTAAVGRSRLVLEPERATPAQLAVGLTPGLLVPDRAADAAVAVLRTADLARLRRCPP